MREKRVGGERVERNEGGERTQKRWEAHMHIGLDVWTRTHTQTPDRQTITQMTQFEKKLTNVSFYSKHIVWSMKGKETLMCVCVCVCTHAHRFRSGY